jgi:hypothetical protein
MEIDGSLMSSSRLEHYRILDDYNENTYLDLITKSTSKNDSTYLEIMRVINRANIFLQLCQELFRRKISLEGQISEKNISSSFKFFTMGIYYKEEKVFCIKYVKMFFSPVFCNETKNRLIEELASHIENGSYYDGNVCIVINQ